MPTIIGHRGGVMGLAKENSLEAFKLATESQLDAIECDLHITKDGVICIYHNFYIKDRTHCIKDMLFKDIQVLEPNICTLDSIESLLIKKIFVFELKSKSNYTRIIDLLWTSYGEILLKHRFISFDANALLYVKQKSKSLYCGYIATSGGDAGRFHPMVTKKDIQLCIENGFEEISGHWVTFSSRMIRFAHHCGLLVGLGPTNTKRRYLHCVKNFVDCVYTDYAERIAEYEKLNNIRLKTKN